MQHWHYQLMRQIDVRGDEYYSMHEYHPAEGKGEDDYIISPVTVDGESVEDIKWLLKTLLSDLEKHGVKDYA
jgi:hypothetical protein